MAQRLSRSAPSDTLLQVDNLSKSFRGVRALEDYRLTLRAGDLLGVIGPNGAGKTTLFNLLTGVVKPTGGSIRLHGDEISRTSPRSNCSASCCSHLPEDTPLSGAHGSRKCACGSAVARRRFPLAHNPLHAGVLGFGAHHRTPSARTALSSGHRPPGRRISVRLSYSEQRRLELACALGLEPELLLLDEPTAGMNPTETDTMINLVLDLQRELRLAIVLIEHNMQVIMNTCRHIQALNYGRIIGEGSPDEIRHDEDVITAYLGHAHRGTDEDAETPAQQTGTE